MSEGKTPKNDVTSLNVHNMFVVSIFFHKICRDRSRGIYANRIILFEIEYSRDGFGQQLAEFQFHSDIAIIRV